MKLKKLPSEGLKLIACLTMLTDHLAVALGLGVWFRVIGRMAFPIYCFLLAEGAHYTGSPVKYALRLGLAMVLSEIPFDLVFRGRLTLGYQNVLLTLLLGFGMLQLLRRAESPVLKLVLAIPFALAAELLHCDYGAQGIAMILLFGLAREYGWGMGKLLIGLILVSLSRASVPIRFLGLPVPIELFSLLGLIPIAFYSGKKATDSRLVQWAFYLFYPVHLAILALL